ncbi:hypothetical protein ON010_g14784 [Phytophthora cinnamomi]|nr:hypothetical protein ON010_g14784 [Phytophthora cinnamomi]
MIASATQLHGIDLGRDTEALVDRSAVLHSGFSRRWTLNPQSVVVLDAVSGRARDILQDFRVIDAAQFVYEAGCVDVELDATTPRLSIQSAFSFANHATKTPMSLLLDGRLRVFRVLPSGLSSMIATTGGWSIGDYAGSLSDDGQSLNMDLFAFAEGYHPHSGVETAVVRRVNLTPALMLGKCIAAGNPIRAVGDSGITVLVVHGRVYCSALRPSKPGLGSIDRASTHRLSTTSSSDRAAMWSEKIWLPLMEMQAEYVGFPLTRGPSGVYWH